METKSPHSGLVILLGQGQVETKSQHQDLLSYWIRAWWKQIPSTQDFYYGGADADGLYKPC